MQKKKREYSGAVKSIAFDRDFKQFQVSVKGYSNV